MPEDRFARIVRIVSVAATRVRLEEHEQEALIEFLAGTEGSLSNAAEYWAYDLVRSNAPDVCGADDAFMDSHSAWIESVGREIGYAARGW